MIVNPFNPDAYVKVRLSGSLPKIRFFHYVMSMLDPDWPWAGEERRDTNENLKCPKCDGLLYRSPLVTPGELKMLGRQVNQLKTMRGNFKVKTDMWNINHKCEVEGLPAPTPDPTKDLLVV